MANDYIPRPDARFHAWRNNFVTYVNGHPTDLGLAAGVMGRACSTLFIKATIGLASPTKPETAYISTRVSRTTSVPHLSANRMSTLSMIW